MKNRSHTPFRVLALTVLALVTAIAVPTTSANAGCMPSALASKLNQIRAKFGPVQVISTHRPGARIAGSGRASYHASCRAVDFNPPPGKYSQVVAWLKANHSGGVGTYSCGMHHIHIDTGPRVRFHKCQGSGRYASRSSKSKKRRYAKAKSKRNQAYVYAPHRKTGRYANAQ
ncbi:MAG: DUF882 domain-containing protein [Hyphomicrobiaceae bacterium]|nr:DUF882 domain-containing protein [Hyphomicrobiaceae bacterium]